MRNIFASKPNTSAPKVFVGLSGGVDSAVSAALLQEQGYDVVGVFIWIALPGYPCRAGQDRVEAMRVAAHLRIPFEEIDLSKQYEQNVYKTSIKEFARGRTPNPDTLCNRDIKFGLFYEWAIAQGAEYIATGHYAQTRDGELYAGADTEKDQSYFLWAVPETALRKTLFPVGHLQKSEVRALAKKFGLPNAERKDSQGLCFLGDITVEDMLTRELSPVTGDVLSEEGEVVGRHEGAARYTLGQRHGFTLTAHTPATQPHFVVDKDIEFNTVTVSTSRTPRSRAQTNVTLAEVNWIGETEDGLCEARFRYRQTLIPALLHKNTVTLKEPHYVPLGQSLVLYLPAGRQAAEMRCLGGGVVDRVQLI